ncbi:MAG: exodeoxyribonuclease V subunit alpha [Colwellia sp.]|nr:exodeoxyribonuclease V subunit alpha [Colwellia sp.]
MSNQSVTLQYASEWIYSSFNQAQRNIAEITAIDYFFAKEMCDALFQNQTKIDSEETGVIFHVLLCLSQSVRNGHSCLPLNSISGQRVGFHSDELGLVTHHGFNIPSVDIMSEYLDKQAISKDDKNLIVYQRGVLYLRRYYEFETELATYIQGKLIRCDLSLLHQEKIKKCIQTLFPQQDELEIDWQKIAVANAINKNFSIIAGGPGTGKTYTVIKLLAALLMLESNSSEDSSPDYIPKADITPLRIALVAPTGKAAQRLSESIIKAVDGFNGKIASNILAAIPSDAQTLHRLLGVIPNSPNFKHHQDNLLSVDVLLIDEVSMVDLALMTRVFRALPQHTKVIMLGDADQLPSVSVGSVLADIAPRPHLGYSPDSISYLTKITNDDFVNKSEFKTLFKSVSRGNKIPKHFADHLVFLTKSRRFDGDGGIGLLAKSVIAGQSDMSWKLLNSQPQTNDGNGKKELTLLSIDIDSWLPNLVKQYFEQMFTCNDVNEAFLLLAKFRLLCATRQGEFGVESLNDKVKLLLMAKGLIHNTDTLYQAQPIMISENDYRLGLYNGDIGVLWRNGSGHLMAVFETSTDELKWIMPSRLPTFTTVYAMTIHKTQGSEFDHVLMVLPKQSNNKLLSRELLYTGITRAKSYLSIATTFSVWQQGVEGQVKRFSGLKIS